jgi:hypothetical protein
MDFAFEQLTIGFGRGQGLLIITFLAPTRGAIRGGRSQLGSWEWTNRGGPQRAGHWRLEVTAVLHSKHAVLAKAVAGSSGSNAQLDLKFFEG